MKGTTAGSAALKIRMREGERDVPTFSVKVAPVQTIGIHAMIICNDGEVPIGQDKIDTMIKTANDIYAQVGMRFYLADITTTNLPSAYDIAPSVVTNDIGDVWRHWQVASLMSGTGGIECYFIHRIVDERRRQTQTAGLTSSYGIVLASICTPYTLAHEIGHLCGAEDIYDYAGSVTNMLPGWVCCENCSEDWNGGCNGRGASGARYYPLGTRMNAIVKRILMNGVETDDEIGRDITNGNVHGYRGVKRPGTAVTQYEEGSVAVGFEFGGAFSFPNCD